MNSKPAISVVMSVFNGAQYLSTTIESILDQSEAGFEFIIVDDGSSDESAEVLQEYAGLDARIRVLHQDHLGLTHALIRGCRDARSDFIARQDVGDLSLASRLKKQKDALDAERSLAFVSSWTDFCGPKLEFLYRAKGRGVADRPTTVADTSGGAKLSDSPSHHASVMFRTASYRQVGGYREAFYFCQDHDLWSRLAEVGKFQILQETLYVARVTPGSISGRYRTKQRRLGKLARKAYACRLEGLPDDDILDEAARIRPDTNSAADRRREAKWLYFIGANLRRNRDQRALAYFLRSLQSYPFSLKTLLSVMHAKLTLSSPGE